MTEQEKVQQLFCEAGQQVQDKINESGIPGPIGQTIVFDKCGSKVIHEISLGNSGSWSDIYKCCTPKKPVKVSLPMTVIKTPALTSANALGDSD